jgi:CheY-like chemotaxis protein
MIIKSTKSILFLVAIIGIFLGTILGIVPGVIALGDGDPVYIQFLVIGALAYAGTTLIVIFIWKQFGKETSSVKTSGAIRVVAIDDEADILRLIRIKLSKEGFDVSTATNGEEGISKVLREKPDVMVVDVMMPGKDGYQVVSEVKAKLGEDAPVTIMLTSKAEDGDMVKGLKVGADDYITKPFSPGELIERINVALIKGVKESK